MFVSCIEAPEAALLTLDHMWLAERWQTASRDTNENVLHA